MKNNKVLIIILIVAVTALEGLICLGTIAKNEEDFTYCKRRIYEFDEIAKGCDKFFKNESWYKTYIKEVEKNYQNLK